MRLTVKEIESVKPTEKTQKLFDGGGLYLQVTPAGSKRWRWKYRIDGRERLLSFGVFPDVGLKLARERRDEARKLLARGIDPSAQRKAEKRSRRDANEHAFEKVAREWYAKQAPNWAASHGDRVIRRLERDVFPRLGRRPVSQITAPEVLTVLRRIEKRGAGETAHRALQNCRQIFRYAVATGRADRDPAADLAGALAPVTGSNFPAITEAKALGALLRAVDAYEGQPATGWALRLAPLVFVRPGELRHAEWAEIDLDSATWVIPAAKVKASKQDHIVPLATQAVAILREAAQQTGEGRYVFPGLRSSDRPISNMTLNAALRRLGFPKEQVSIHGFRATARTMLDEILGYRPDWIEHQLAHRVRDPNGTAYNRTAFLEGRREMMQRWADYLDGLKEGGEVVRLRTESA